jgi:uncharacterized protein involved in copper resistance
MMVGPVLVTVEAPNTATLWVVPRGGAVAWANAAWNGTNMKSAVIKTIGTNLTNKLPNASVRTVEVFIVSPFVAALKRN